jgi:hypothetical protein
MIRHSPTFLDGVIPSRRIGPHNQKGLTENYSCRYNVARISSVITQWNVFRRNWQLFQACELP